MGNLSAGQIWKLPPGRHSDGGTLHLLVQPTGSRSWTQRLTIDGVRVDLGLGSTMLVALGKARKRALANRVLVADGGDPRAERRRRRAQAVPEAAAGPTFREAAAKAFEANRARWRGARAATEWRQQLERYAFPVLGEMPILSIGRGDVLRALESTWVEKPALARKLRTRIRSIFSWAIGAGHIEANPVDLAAGALPAQRVVKAHHRALPHAETGAAMVVIRASVAPATAKAALEFAILTAARSGEARLAKWAEINVERRTWTIPAARMKAHREHRVPLSDAALAVLDRLRPLQRSRRLVDLPVAVQAGRGAIGRGAIAGARGYGLGRAGERSRLPIQFSRLVRRQRAPPRSRRGRVGAHGRRHRGRLLPVRFVRQAPRVDAAMGGLHCLIDRGVYSGAEVNMSADEIRELRRLAGLMTMEAPDTDDKAAARRVVKWCNTVDPLHGG